MAPIATASDGAGSIRIPAASCGLFGLKPQRGRISLAPALEHWHGLSVRGCEARHVIDTALFLDVTSGGSAEPGAPPPQERTFVESASTPPSPLRIATSVKPLPGIPAPILWDEVAGAVAATAELLRSLGHHVAERDPDWGMATNNFMPRYLRGIEHDASRVAHPERLERRTRAIARLGSLIPNSVLDRARAAEARDRERVNAIFDEFDVVMTPVMGRTALPVRRWEGQGALLTLLGMSRFYPYCGGWNHLGNPAAAVPAGFTDDGMPLSVQLIGQPNDEGTLLSLAAQLEAERPWAEARPPIS
jgi:amidase